MRGGRSLAGIRQRYATQKAEDSDTWCQQVISRLTPPDERVFHVVVDHVVFYMIHFQVQYKKLSQVILQHDASNIVLHNDDNAICRKHMIL